MAETRRSLTPTCSLLTPAWNGFPQEDWAAVATPTSPACAAPSPECNEIILKVGLPRQKPVAKTGTGKI